MLRFVSEPMPILGFFLAIQYQAVQYSHCSNWLHADKKENQIFLIFKEIQNGEVEKSYMREGFLIYEDMRKYLPIYEEAVSHTYMTLQLLHSEFPYI
jgi:hypothetical protein